MGGLEVDGRGGGVVFRLDGWVWCVGGGWVGVVKSGGSVGWCVTWPCDISLERVRRHLCHGMAHGWP